MLNPWSCNNGSGSGHSMIASPQRRNHHFPCTVPPHSRVTQFPSHREKHGWSQVGVRRKHYLPPSKHLFLVDVHKAPLSTSTSHLIREWLCTRQAHPVQVLTSATKDRLKNRCPFSQITTGWMELPPQPTVCDREALDLSYIKKYA